jgi:hypothetical protein
MALPKVKIRKTRPPKAILPAPHKPRADTGDEAELLTGTVQGMKASAPEERLFNALRKIGISAEFRHTMGAPRGLPGWFEVDALVPVHGIVYAVEVDTEFTHRQKQRADVLHDARVLKSLEGQGMQVYPSVIHLDGESDLVDQKWALATVKRHFQ